MFNLEESQAIALREIGYASADLNYTLIQLQQQAGDIRKKLAAGLSITTIGSTGPLNHQTVAEVPYLAAVLDKAVQLAVRLGCTSAEITKAYTTK